MPRAINLEPLCRRAERLSVFAWVFRYVRAAPSLIPLALVVTIALADVAASDDREARSHARTSKSPSVDLVGYGLNTNILFLRASVADTGEWGNYPRIWLDLVNRADRPLWAVVRMRAPFPDRLCEHRFSLERKERTRMLCTQDSVTAAVDYAVGITAFADSGFADTVDASSWHLQLAKSEVQEWESKRRLDREIEEAKKLRQSDPQVPAPHAASPKPVGHDALHLAVRDVGISFGNAPRVHGLRFNSRDRELERVNGFDLTVVGTENPGAVIHGVGAVLWSDFSFFWVDEIVGVGVSPTAFGVKHSRGVMVGAGMLTVEDAVGIQLGGLGLVVSGRATGIQAGGVAVYGGPMSGLTVAGLFGWSENGPMTGINAGGLGVRAPTLAGINVGGVMVGGDEGVTGINVAGLIVAGDERVTGISAAGLMVTTKGRLMGIGVGPLVFAPYITGIAAGGWVGRPGWGRDLPEDPTLRGIAAAGIVMTRDLTGLSVAGYHRVDGVQRGVTIGLVNDARNLHGVQIGIVNTARNNRGAFRTLPLLNVHFGR